MNWSQFFHMGGYALYVWGVYLAAAVILVINVWVAIRRTRLIRTRLKTYLAIRGTDE